MIKNKYLYFTLASITALSAIIFFALRSDIDTVLLPPSAQLPDGGRYYGELKDQLFSGEGKIIWTNGASYHGQFYKGQFHGIGKHIDSIGNTYEGQFVNGVLTGQGQITTIDGTSYKGQIENSFFNGHGRKEFGDSSYYVGQFKNNLYHGYGLLFIKDGDSYNGNFIKGQYDGEGEIHYANNDSYKGHFKKGKIHGKGRYTSTNDGVYEGDFINENFTGQGVYTDQDNNRFEGEFNDWMLDGKGHYHSADGDYYEGDFEFGSFSGEGIYKGKKGRTYQGEFENWSFHGQGTLLESNGDRYQGKFSYGNYDGKGILTYAAPIKGKSVLRGKWRYGRYIGDGSQPDPREANTEKALYLQNRLLDETNDNILSTDPKHINLYFVGVGGDGKQNVFYQEVSYIRELFDQSFGTKGRSAILINNAETVDEIPLATVTSIERTLNNVADKMDSKNDILFLYLTSHGSKKHKLSIDQHGLALPDLSANHLAKILASLPTRWKVVVISACYSGGFIAPLENEHTLIITASAHNRTSFGCSDEAEMTYFGRAFFKESVLTSPSFASAFENAKLLVHEWEEKTLEDKKNHHSNPQISSPKRIINYLKKWRKQLKKQNLDFAEAEKIADIKQH